MKKLSILIAMIVLTVILGLAIYLQRGKIFRVANKKFFNINFVTSSVTSLHKLNVSSTWIIADVHTHINGCSMDLTPEDLVKNMQKNKVDITSFLIWSKGLSNPAQRALITGKDSPASKSGNILHADVEISQVPAAKMGHLILLGLQSLGFSNKPDVYPISDIPIVEWAAKQNPPVIVGQAHGQWALRGEDFSVVAFDTPYDFPIHVARGHIDFIELIEWYGEKGGNDVSILNHVVVKLLNSGFRITFASGSDYTCLSEEIGSTKTHALIEGELSYFAFLDAILKGRTTITDEVERDDWVSITINGSELGSEIQAKAGEVLNIEIESNLREESEVEIISNGKILSKVPMSMGKDKKQINLSLNSSGWFIARTKHTLTSPIYVVVDKKLIRVSAQDACYLVRYVDNLTSKVKSGILDLGEDESLTLSAYAEARVEFMKRFKEAGGLKCE
jgi:hypothetical protein